jgi:hypothetical protein
MTTQSHRFGTAMVRSIKNNNGLCRNLILFDHSNSGKILGSDGVKNFYLRMGTNHYIISGLQQQIWC